MLQILLVDIVIELSIFSLNCQLFWRRSVKAETHVIAPNARGLVHPLPVFLLWIFLIQSLSCSEKRKSLWNPDRRVRGNRKVILESLLKYILQRCLTMISKNCSEEKSQITTFFWRWIPDVLNSNQHFAPSNSNWTSPSQSLELTACRVLLWIYNCTALL